MPPRDITGTTSEQPLSDYVQAYLERTGLSARELSRSSVDVESGQRLLHTYISALAAAEVPRVPDLWRLKALAAGIAKTSTSHDEGEYRRRLDELKRLAAIQWLDLGDVLRVDTGGGTWVTVTVPPTMSESDRETLKRWAENMARDLDKRD